MDTPKDDPQTITWDPWQVSSTEHPLRRIDDNRPPLKTSDGGSTDYYKIPENAKDLQDLIEHRDMGFSLGNIFKACYRFGEKDGASQLYDINKIIFFAERIKARLTQ